MTIKSYARERILINKEVIDFEQFDNKTLSEFIDYFIELKKSYAIEFSCNEPILDIYRYGCDGGYDFVLNVFEDESDESFKARVAKMEYAAKMTEDKILEKERKLYELLKQKFENQSTE